MFRSHGERDPFLPRFIQPPDVLLLESADTPHRWQAISANELPDKPNRFSRGEKRYAKIVENKGGRIYYGESTPHFKPQMEHRVALLKWLAAGHHFSETPTFDNWKLAEAALSWLNTKREGILSEKIKGLLRDKKNILAPYGTEHVLLAKKLQREGHPVRLEIIKAPLPPYSKFRLKERLGKPVSTQDLQLAYLSNLLDSRLSVERLSEREKDFLCDTLMRSFREPTKLNILFPLANKVTNHQAIPPLVRVLAVGNAILQANGLPANATRKELMAWLNQHSKFWQLLKKKKRLARMRQKGAN